MSDQECMSAGGGKSGRPKKAAAKVASRPAGSTMPGSAVRDSDTCTQTASNVPLLAAEPPSAFESKACDVL